MKNARLPEPKFIQEDMFRTIVYRKQTEQVTVKKTTQKTTQKILDIISQNSSVSRRELSNLIGNITEDGIKYQLIKLKKEGIIKRIGAARGGYWEIINTKNLEK